MKLQKFSYRLLNDITASIFIFLFVYTSLSKLTAYNAFKAQLAFFPLIKYFYASVAWLIPVVELATACLLVFHKTRMTGLIVSLALMIIFTGYLAIMLLQYGKSLPCSCGGFIEGLTWKKHIWLNLFLTAVAVAGIVSEFKLRDKLLLQ
jgi:hypothetical protein